MSAAVINLAERRESRERRATADAASAILQHVKPASEWRLEFMRMKLADDERNAACWRMLIAKREHGLDSDAFAQTRAAHREAEDRFQYFGMVLLFVAAPDVTALRWKERWAGAHPKHPEIAAALDRDRIALAAPLASIAKRSNTIRQRKGARA